MTKFLTTVTFFAIPLTLAISAMPASALNTYLLSANFVQGGNFGGTFDYDSVTDVVSNVNISTPNEESFTPFTYRTGFTANFTATSSTFTQDRLFTFSGSGQGVTGNPGSVLTLFTDGPLLNSLLPGSIVNLIPAALLNPVGSREDQNINGGIVGRFITGTITTVPFEFNPAVGVVLLGLGFGVSKIKNKAAKKSV